MNMREKTLWPKNVFAAITKDSNSLMKSTSGGVFGTLAEEAIKEGSVVYGASYSDDLYRVKHISVTAVNEVDKLRGSKYTESEIVDCYKDVMNNLDGKKHVFFSGTPCQVASLKKFLAKDYDNLLTCNLICFGIPIKQLYTDYIHQQEEIHHSKIISFSFRDKISGWQKSSIKAVFENGHCYIRKHGKDPYMIAFNSNIAIRKACTRCTHKGFPQPGDITIGDFWGIGYDYPDLEIEKGVSVVLINTEKGDSFFKRYQHKFLLRDVDIRIALRGNPSLTMPSQPHIKRDKFIADYDKHGYEYVERKYLKPRSGFRRRLSRLKKRIINTIK